VAQAAVAGGTPRVDLPRGGRRQRVLHARGQAHHLHVCRAGQGRAGKRGSGAGAGGSGQRGASTPGHAACHCASVAPTERVGRPDSGQGGAHRRAWRPASALRCHLRGAPAPAARALRRPTPTRGRRPSGRACGSSRQPRPVRAPAAARGVARALRARRLSAPAALGRSDRSSARRRPLRRRPAGGGGVGWGWGGLLGSALWCTSPVLRARTQRRACDHRRVRSSAGHV
jgi:hypothetical protein